ncbi:tetratricopeptide repeat protein [Roseateles sp. GG27B]
MTTKFKCSSILFILTFLLSHSALAQMDCGPLSMGQFGPFDYRPEKHRNVGGIEIAPGGSEHKAILSMVEGAHFKPEIEALLRGKTLDSTPGGDLGYTLHSIPNHHRALFAVMRYGEKLKTDRPRDLKFSVECYFERAVRFAPDDAIARMLFAQFLISKNRQPEAIQQLAFAENLAGENGFTHYNLGLIYFDAGAPEKALQKAHQAAALGFPRQDLEQKLRAAGKWQDAALEPSSQALVAPSETVEPKP